ncbi:ABC transporter substrate-binding protein [Hyphococcus formosus]|uniref:ABC transporter substrate-binding protein n=1 Tax=Hyphococcus formosus TaxID=3143534 RepID=UPI00398BB155
MRFSTRGASIMFRDASVTTFGNKRSALRLILIVGALFVALLSNSFAKDQLVLGVPLEPPNLDPTSGAAAAVDAVVYGNIFEGLTRITQTGDVAPALAESWDAAPDRLSYVFYLRRDVTFHDGTEFDAYDVKFSLDRALAPESSNAQKALLSPISAVDVIDPFTVRLNLRRPSSDLPYYLGWGDAVIVAEESAATNAMNPVGTGPFKYARWRRGDSLTLTRYENYWGGKPQINSVVFKFIGDAAAAFSSMKAGDIDAYPNYPAPENVAEFENDPRFKVIAGASEGKVILAINNRNSPLANRNVRRAISHAIDREAIIDGAMFGFGFPIGSHYTRQSPGYVDLVNRYPNDIEKAKSLLADAGYPNGFALSLRLPPRPYARRAGEIVAAQLAQVGIDVTIENLEWAQWLDQVFKRHEFDLTIVEHIEPMDFGIYARDDYYFGYSNPEYNALVARYEIEVDEKRRAEIIGEIQRILADDAVNGYLLQSARVGIWRADLNGLWVDTPIPANIAANAFFTGSQASVSSQGEVKRGNNFVWVLAAIVVAIFIAVSVIRSMGLVYLLGRVGSHGATLFAASVVIFVLMQIVPGDPAAYMMGLNASPESISALRAQMGLDAPSIVRYFDWIGGVFSGEFGTSYTYQVPVGELIAERLQVSAPLALLAMFISLLIAIPVGVIAASRRGSAIDTGLNAVMQIGIALPNFWIAMLLIIVFSIQLGWFSAGGFVGWDAGFFSALKALFLPAVALAAPQAAIIARVLRSSLLDVMNEDFIRTARAKGLSWEAALWRHALRNAFIPVLTIIGLQFPFLLAGGIIIENVFSLPGLGRLVFQAITQRDLMVVQSVVFVLVFAVILVTFLIDLAYLVVDPRLRSRIG